MKEIIIVPTYNRPELLFCCLKRLREYAPGTPIAVFADRGTAKDPVVQKAAGDVALHFVPEHDYYGNTFNTMNALLWAYQSGAERVFYVESDVMVHSDFFDWHRHVLDEAPDPFCSMAWVFNRHIPLVDQVLFQGWYYSIGVCFPRKSLGHIVEHATPRYYQDMRGYIETRFRDSKLNSPWQVQHYEQDGLIQRVIEKLGAQTVSPGLAKCSHMGFVRSYGAGDVDEAYASLLEVSDGTFEDRVNRIEVMIADPYFRARMFGRDIVERELGWPIPKRILRYRITIPSGWQSEFTSELTRDMLPPKINSVRVPPDAIIDLID